MSTNVQASRRLDFIDAHRGLAVLLMLWMHTADGWLRPELKQGAAWDLVRALGGLAAPTFLLLAGIGLTLGWGTARLAPDPALAATARRFELARGLQLVVLGYALRMQMWMLDAAGYRLAEGWAAAVPLAAAYAAAYAGLDAWARRLRSAALLGLIAACGALVGYGLVAVFIPDRFGPLLRIDVLQAIGMSLVVLAGLRDWLRRSPELGLLLAAGVAMATPLLRDAMPAGLPPSIAGYVAQWDTPPGTPQPTLFPLFPWMSYALVGAYLGVRLGDVQRRDGSAARAMVWLAGVALVVALLTCEPLAPARALRAHWPVVAPLLRVAYRVAAAVLLGGVAVLLAHRRAPLRAPLIALGRASLVVYWIHLQFAFGAAVKPIMRTLDFNAWSIGLVALCAAMAALATGWVRLRTWLRREARAHAVQEMGKGPAALTGA